MNEAIEILEQLFKDMKEIGTDKLELDGIALSIYKLRRWSLDNEEYNG